ncbi:34700_t:CDS:2 [Gigaspora margarita]|uniref:34700_t:CDS:1 n=1 Tax=Gigaspora margarita TaxID=4874 RepID=A0ABN7VIP6_GIGMA|nr:34700_t:CDS:2 [Gigaspora margarita]
MTNKDQKPNNDTETLTDKYTTRKVKEVVYKQKDEDSIELDNSIPGNNSSDKYTTRKVKEVVYKQKDEDSIELDNSIPGNNASNIKNSKSSSDRDDFNVKQNSDSIASNGDSDNNFEDSSLKSINNNNGPHIKQSQASIISSDDSNYSSKHMKDLNPTLHNDTPNNEQNSKSTSGNDILNFEQANDYSKVEKTKSILSSKIISISILVAVIAIFIFYYEPVDSPIFRNLVNTTNLLSRQLAELNMPASSVIIGYRSTSKSLADIINRNKLSSENSEKVAQYLNLLGDKLSNSGEAIEKMYFTGNHALNEIVSELTTINDEISREKIITRHDAVYFNERYEKILKAITKLRNEFQITLSELDELYDLYSGTRHQLTNGMKDVELFFDEVTPELKELHNIEKLKRNLSYLTQIMKKVPDFRSRIRNILFEFNKHRSVLIGYRSEWVGLRRRKLVSPEDTKELEDMIQKLMVVIRIFAKKDLENTEKRIYIT